MFREINSCDVNPDRFWRFVDKTGDCWLWTANRDRQGYGKVCIARHSLKAHRVAYALEHGSTPTDAVIDHLCRTPACVNPGHLEATTVQVNTARGVGPCAAAARARLTGRCVNGHDLALVGCHRVAGRKPTCAECGRLRVRRYQARKRAAA